MKQEEALRELAGIVAENSKRNGAHGCAVPQVQCFRFEEPYAATPALYTPSLCVIVQGEKQVLLGDEIHRYAPSQFLAASVDMPVMGQVLEASREKPYLCLAVELDAKLLAELMPLVKIAGAASVERGLFVGKLDEGLLDSVLRLGRLLRAPEDVGVLAPLAIREIYYRLLKGEHGRRIAQIAIADSHMQRIAGILHRLKQDFTSAWRVEDLAEMANMSASSFHQHFKAVTAMSPVQYQKKLRLLEARRLLLAEEADATRAAYRVGYESASQFSREYARMFGAPPMRDVEQWRGAAR
jgi:AraC-like DNA-binding protein